MTTKAESDKNIERGAECNKKPSPNGSAPRKSGLVKPDDAIFRIVGIGKSETPGGLSSRKRG